MIDQLQAHLEAIYGIRCEQRVSDFVIDAGSALALGGSARAREELLVHEDDEGLELALYLDAPLVGRLASVEPARAVELDLAGFCEVTEGVSHFLYLACSAALDRSVSLLELEAQAEVDKFALCALLRWSDRRAGRTLVERLFDEARLRASLSDLERWRYEESSRLARAYCERLVPLVAAGRLGLLLGELRRGYRLRASAKLHYFARP